jgi:hypothetical protein
MEIHGTCLQCFCLLIMFVKARSRLQRLPTVVAITCWGMPGGTPLIELCKSLLHLCCCRLTFHSQLKPPAYLLLC